MLTLFFAFVALMGSAHAERPRVPRSGNFEFGASYSYFDTSANYDNGGNKVAIPNSGGLTTHSGTLSTGYEFMRRFRTYGSVGYANVSTTDGFFDRQNGAATDVSAGGQYFGALGRLLIVPQIDVSVPLYRINEGSDQAAMTEGVVRFRGGAWGIWRLGQMQPYAFLGGEYRDGGRASLLPYALGAHWRVQNFWIQGEARGFVSLTSDEDDATTGRSRRDAYLRRVNGGSYRFYGVNPALHELALEGGLDFSGFTLFGGAAFTFAGTSAAQGWGATVGVRYVLATGPTRARRDYNPIPSGGRFEVQSQEYDESLFREKPRTRTRRRGRPRPTPRQQNLDRLLQETEQTLE